MWVRSEILIALIVSFLIYNIHNDWKYTKIITQIAQGWKKYYQMAIVVFGGVILYVLVKKTPGKCKDLLETANQFIKYMPIDKSSKDFLTPALNIGSSFLSTPNSYQNDNTTKTVTCTNTPMIINKNDEQGAILPQHAQIKRSVSETKKKVVASSQSWKCGKCNNQLNAWYEIDHIKGLEYGGSNEIDNLIALCRECHGEKTAMARL
jgi:hypothetical protein